MHPYNYLKLLKLQAKPVFSCAEVRVPLPSATGAQLQCPVEGCFFERGHLST